MSKYSGHCCLCSNKRLRRKKTAGQIFEFEHSFHKFPKDETRSAWIKFASFLDTDDVTNLLICSDHFTKEDFLVFETREGSALRKLKKGAVPSIQHSVCKKQEQEPTTASTSFSKENISRVATISLASPSTSSILLTTHLNPVENSLVSSCAEILPIPYYDGSGTTPAYSYSTCDASTQTDEKEDVEIYRSPEVPAKRKIFSPQVVKEQTLSHSTPKKRRFSEPRYTGEIKSPDVSSPKKARRTLQLAMDTVSKQKRKLKTLQEANRYMKKKICNMKDLLNHLQKKNLLSEEAANSVVAHKF